MKLLYRITTLLALRSKRLLIVEKLKIGGMLSAPFSILIIESAGMIGVLLMLFRNVYGAIAAVYGDGVLVSAFLIFAMLLGAKELLSQHR